ncbi:MAG: MotA/TolQ/ExbB proton channel family protein [Actinobacteria bacterium HGW-Actinobacteria-1]|jgi:biopolymer transport protein ExbB/TolQ|nr:MAG: MotA/TolQ/ExbB proton channel family protein [Actinobacteria bacterium HGW-Actinobacteria-1]
MLDGIRYLLTTPQAIIYEIATALLYPVLFIEVIALAWAVFELGSFTWEALRRRGRRSLRAMDEVTTRAALLLADGKSEGALTEMRRLPGRGWVRTFFAEAEGADWHERTRLLKRLTDLESRVSKTLERTRILVRLGPMLGLMGTLIPISPALIGLAKGDVQTLSDNLVVAFSTTVIGLLIGGLGYVVSTVRDRWYGLDVSDIEYALDRVEEHLQ